MNNNLLYIVLWAVLVACSLNLFFVIRLSRILLERSDRGEDMVPLVGSSFPDFESHHESDAINLFRETIADGSSVLVFLSSGCAACRTKVTEISGAIGCMREKGVSLWIAGADDTHDISTLTADTPVKDRLIHLPNSLRKQLNPTGAVPLYIFLEDGIIRAGGGIGDDNWRNFMDDVCQDSGSRSHAQ
jgi:hypothetical protein